MSGASLRRPRLLDLFSGGGTTHHRPGSGRGGYQGRAAERREAMGIDWLPREALNLAVPPAYTEHIGRQLLTCLAPGVDSHSTPG